MSTTPPGEQSTLAEYEPNTPEWPACGHAPEYVLDGECLLCDQHELAEERAVRQGVLR